MRKQATYTENRIFPYGDMDELEDELFTRVRKIVENLRPDHPWASMDKMELLKSAGMCRNVFERPEHRSTRYNPCGYFDFW